MRPQVSYAVAATLLLALALLATLQYRWIARLSDAEQERLQSGLDAAATRFVDDFDRELMRAFRALQPEEGIAPELLAGDLATRLARFRASAPEPDLVQELLVVTREGQGDISLRRLDEPAGSLVPASFEPHLEPIRAIFLGRNRIPRIEDEVPSLILPIRSASPPAEASSGGRRPLRDHAIVRLNRDRLTRSFLPRLARREFGSGETLVFSIAVLSARVPDRVIFEAGPGRTTSMGEKPPDAVRRFFALRNFQDLATRSEPGRPPRPEPPDGGPPQGADPPRAPANEDGLWILEVRHPSGSLETAVARARRNNFGISLAILTLLGASALFLVTSTRRSQKLARQQMDFVAAVSHELKTPLTAIRSAGQNLAAGIIDDEERIRKYGGLIEAEGRRLTDMVSRVLAFAGLQSGSQVFRMEPLQVRDLVEGVLADFRWVLDEKSIRVETEITDGLPRIVGDRASLCQALGNLIDNAIKYGGPARWIGVKAHTVKASEREEVVVSVSDRGLGIRRNERPRLFDAFFRGADAVASGVGGSGLGLAVVRGVVEAHGGRIGVESEPEKGSTFSIHFPAKGEPS